MRTVIECYIRKTFISIHNLSKMSVLVSVLYKEPLLFNYVGVYKLYIIKFAKNSVRLFWDSNTWAINTDYHILSFKRKL